MSEVARELITMARESDGGTVALHGHSLPTTGYFVGGRIPSLILSEEEVSRRAVIYQVIDFVSRAGTPYVGVWRDSETGKIYFDAVEWYYDEYSAGKVARERRELAVWDISGERELRLV